MTDQSFASDPTSAGGSPSPAGGGQASPLGSPADGGGAAPVQPSDEQDAATGQWPANWADIMAGGDVNKQKQLSRFHSPIALANSWMAQRQKISTGDLLKAKPDGKDEKGLAEWRIQAGIPDKPDGYLEKLPDGLVFGEQDQERLKSFVEDMHSSDMPPQFVHKALGWYQKLQEQESAAQYERDNHSKQAGLDALNAEWGQRFRPNINGMQNMLESYGGKDATGKIWGARLADGTPLGNDPDVIRLLVSLSHEINPHGIVVPATGGSVDQSIKSELAQLEIEMKDTNPKDPNSYWKNQAKQERYRQLQDHALKISARGA